jgi:hypothetical protein
MGKRAAKGPDLLVALLPSVALILVALFEAGPLGFLPHLLRWPLVACAIAALWLPRLEAQRSRLPAWTPRALEAVALALVFGSYLLLKLVGLHASDTDDNIYFYMADRLAHGVLPYRDFFFAHPPVHLFVPAIAFKILGFSLPLAKSIPVLAQVAAGACLYISIRPTSRPLALVAVLLHLTAYEVLMGSTDMDGENLMTAFLAAAILCAGRKRFLASGICAGLALGTGLYALAGVLALLVASLGSSRRALVLYAAGLAGCVALWAGIFGAIGGAAFWDGVLRYHFAKAPAGDHLPLFASANPLRIAGAYVHDLGAFLGGRTLGKSFFYHTPLYLAALLGVGLAARAALAQPGERRGWRRLLKAPLSGTPEGPALLSGLAALLFVLQWAALNEVYDFYLVPMVVSMCLPAAYALVRVVAMLAQARTLAGLGWPVALAAVLCLSPLLARATHDGLWPEELRDRGQVARYAWRDPMVLAGPAQLTRALFFWDSRAKGEINAPYRHYLWNKSLSLSSASEIARYVEAGSAPEDTLTGASTMAPLVALLAHRRLAADEADTNNKRFRSGMLTDRAFWQKACADRVRFVLCAPRSHFTEELMERDPTARRFFVRDRPFDDATVRHFRSERLWLYRLREGPCAVVDEPASR